MIKINNSKISRMKALLNQQRFLLLVGCLFFCGCSSHKAQTSLTLSPCDTVVFSRPIAFVRSIYMPEYDTQVNTYARPSISPEFESEFCFCINSLTPVSVFPLHGKVRDFIIEDVNSMILRPCWDSLFYRIDSLGKTVNILSGYFAEPDNDKLSIFTLNFGFPLKKEGEKRLFYTHLYNPKDSENAAVHFNEEKKEKHFSRPCVSEFLITENQIINTRTPIAPYPKIFTEKGVSYSSYISHVALNRNLDVITCFLHIDSLFVNSPNHELKCYPLHSIYKTKRENYDSKQMHDKVYTAQYACKHTSYTNLLYDSYRNQYYVMVSKATNYENSDGTFNAPEDKPWSLMIIDSTYNKIAEIDMPDHYSKHEIMIVPNGIAIQEKNLTEKNQYPVYVIHKIEKQ